MTCSKAGRENRELARKEDHYAGLSWHHHGLAIKRWGLIHRVRRALEEPWSKGRTWSLLCLTADCLLQPFLFLNFSAEESLREYKTCQNELVVLGSLWTYGHPAFSKDGGKTFISGTAEGKKKSLISMLLRTHTVWFALLAVRTECWVQEWTAVLWSSRSSLLFYASYFIISVMLSNSVKAFFSTLWI